MNELPSAKQQHLRELFLQPGMTIRRAASIAQVAKRTAATYRDRLGLLPNCICGQVAGHRGWCAFRFSRSTKRQALPMLRFRGVTHSILANPRCSVKACAFPAIIGTLCRKHHDDQQALFSPFGSSCLPAIREAHLLFLGTE